jgi:hypothetical protein
MAYAMPAAEDLVLNTPDKIIVYLITALDKHFNSISHGLAGEVIAKQQLVKNFWNSTLKAQCNISLRTHLIGPLNQVATRKGMAQHPKFWPDIAKEVNIIFSEGSEDTIATAEILEITQFFIQQFRFITIERFNDYLKTIYIEMDKKYIEGFSHETPDTIRWANIARIDREWKRTIQGLLKKYALTENKSMIYAVKNFSPTERVFVLLGCLAAFCGFKPQHAELRTALINLLNPEIEGLLTFIDQVSHLPADSAKGFSAKGFGERAMREHSHVVLRITGLRVRKLTLIRLQHYYETHPDIVRPLSAHEEIDMGFEYL